MRSGTFGLTCHFLTFFLKFGNFGVAGREAARRSVPVSGAGGLALAQEVRFMRSVLQCFAVIMKQRFGFISVIWSLKKNPSNPANPCGF